MLLFLLVCCSGPQADASLSLTSPFTKAWSYLTTDTLRYKEAVSDGQNVYVPLEGGQILALKVHSGERSWTAKSDGELIAGLQVDDRSVYLATASASESDEKTPSFLVALDKRTGEVLWRRSFDEHITALTQPARADQHGASRLYVGTASGWLIALHPPTQEPIWKFQSIAAIRGHISQHEAVVYVGSDDGALYAVDAETGKERWRFRSRGPVRSGVEMSANRIYFGSFDGAVYCLDKQTGKRRWMMQTGGAIQARPLLADENLIVGSYDNFVYSVDPHSGARRWKVNVGGRIIADPMAQGDAILISVLRDHKVVVLHGDNGREINSLELGQGIEIVAAPVVGDDVLILTTNQGVIAARTLSTNKS
jgi:outer membrane protein assembly factor BamB